MGLVFFYYYWGDRRILLLFVKPQAFLIDVCLIEGRPLYFQQINGNLSYLISGHNNDAR